MARREAPRAAARRQGWTALAGLVAVAAVLTGLAGMARPAVHRDGGVAARPAVPIATRPSGPTSGTDADGAPERRAPARSLGEADGVVPAGVTVFSEVPAVAKLHPALLGALRRAALDAARAGHVTFSVNSGWRSAAYQEQLLLDAVSKYGSRREASRWVATPQASAHVSGNAVDIGPATAAAWLSEHGSRYGLCQIYQNEPWHYELRPEATHQGCPARYADPRHDPRLQP